MVLKHYYINKTVSCKKVFSPRILLESLHLRLNCLENNVYTSETATHSMSQIRLWLQHEQYFKTKESWYLPLLTSSKNFLITSQFSCLLYPCLKFSHQEVTRDVKKSQNRSLQKTLAAKVTLSAYTYALFHFSMPTRKHRVSSFDISQTLKYFLGNVYF